MRKWLLFVLACCAGFSGIAQPVPPLTSSDDDGALTRAQMRNEIRTFLSANWNAEQSESSATPAPVLRQLSSRELAEMREQLRRPQPRQQPTRP